MALFGSKQKKEAKTDTPKAQESATAVVGGTLASVIVRPHVTEKAVLKTDQNIYTFQVRQDASKDEIKRAVQQYWKVTPIKVHTVTRKPRNVMARARGRKVHEKGYKKAYVYLKQGDSINL